MNPISQVTKETVSVAANVTREGETTIVEVADTMTKEQALETQSFIAQTLLATEGWSILEQLALVNAEAMQTTQLFVLPVIAEEELIRTTLGDTYEEFKQGFDALREDLATMADVLVSLAKRHAGKEGSVEPEEQALVAELAMGYSKIQTQMETQVGPELMKQMSILEAGGVSADRLYQTFVASQVTSE
ncbi:hypothetical protein D3C81_223320 [compost metagenome]